MSFIPDLAKSDIAREALSKRNLDMLQHAKRTAETIGLPEKYQRDEKYYNFHWNIKGQKANEFRYNKTFEILWQFVPLLTTNRPGIGLRARNPLSFTLTDVYNQYLAYLLDSVGYDSAYKYAIIDACKFGTGYMKLCTNPDGSLRVDTPSPVGVYLGDYTEKDIWLQPCIQEPVLLNIDDALDRWPHLRGKIEPTEDSEHLNMLEKVFSFFKDMTLSINNTEKISLKDEIKKQWHLGKVVAIETMTMRNGKVFRCYDVNGQPAEALFPGWEHYPYAQYKMYPQNMHALGMSLTELTYCHSDAVTSYIQNMLRYLNTITHGIYIVPKGAKIDKKTMRELLRDGEAIFEMDDRYVQAGRQAMQPIQPPAMPSGIIEASSFINSIADRQMRSGPLLERIPGASESPADKALMQSQSGAAHLKFMAQFFSDDATYKFGYNVLHYMQTMVDKNDLFEVVGQYTDDGRPKFVEINRLVDTEMMARMYEQAINNEELDPDGIGMTQLSPQEFIDQYLMIEQEKEKELAAGGQVPMHYLNDLRIGKFRIDVSGGDVLPYTRMQQQKYGAMLAEMGMLPDDTLLELFDFDPSPEMLARLPKRIAEQQAQQMQQQQMQLQLAQLQMQAQQQQGNSGNPMQ